MHLQNNLDAVYIYMSVTTKKTFPIQPVMQQSFDLQF